MGFREACFSGQGGSGGRPWGILGPSKRQTAYPLSISGFRFPFMAYANNGDKEVYYIKRSGGGHLPLIVVKQSKVK